MIAIGNCDLIEVTQADVQLPLTFPSQEGEGMKAFPPYLI